MDGTDLHIGFTCTQADLLAYAETSRHRGYVTPYGSTGVLYIMRYDGSFSHIYAEPVKGSNEWECRIWVTPQTEDYSFDRLVMEVLLATEGPSRIARVNPNAVMEGALNRGLDGIAWSPELCLLQGFRNLTIGDNGRWR